MDCSHAFARAVHHHTTRTGPALPPLRLDLPTSPVSPSPHTPRLPPPPAPASALPPPLSLRSVQPSPDVQTKPLSPLAPSSSWSAQREWTLPSPISIVPSRRPAFSPLTSPVTPQRLTFDSTVPASTDPGTVAAADSPEPHPSVSEMDRFSDPHPLNILADISSVARKSPVRSQTESRCTTAPLKVIYKRARAQKPGTAVSMHGTNPGHAAVSKPTKERIFVCDQCSSRFNERFNLNKHIRAVHERRRPFQCSTCHARFQQRDHMQKHEMCVHKKLRQFSCGVCNASFGWRGVLKKHRRSVHGLAEWWCLRLLPRRSGCWISASSWGERSLPQPFVSYFALGVSPNRELTPTCNQYCRLFNQTCIYYYTLKWYWF